MRVSLSIFAGSILAVSVPADAQQMVDIPIWSNGILGQQALRSAYDNADRASGIRSRKGPTRACSADALPAADRRAMEVQYMRRLKEDGKASADAWVNEQGRRFHAKLVAEGKCPAPGKRVASDARRAAKPVLDKNGKRCTHTRLENRPTANVGGGAMTMGMVPVCAD